MLNFFPLVLDSTQLEAYKNCPIRFFRNHVQHLQQDESIDLIAGGAFAHGIHKAREAYYTNGKDADEAVSIGIAELYEEYGDFYDPWKLGKSVHRMALALESYFNEYPMQFDDVRPLKLADSTHSIEYSLLSPIRDYNGDFILHPVLGKPLLFSGRLDMLASYNGGIYMVDEKTTGSYFTKNWSQQWETRGQFSGYSWLGKQSGIPELANINGAIVRGICLPSSSSTNEDTKNKFYGNIESIKHQSCITNRTQYEVDCWERDMIRSVLAMVDSYTKYLAGGEVTPERYFGGAWGSSCTSYGRGCQFIDTCKSVNGERFLETNAQNIWLPEQHRRVPLEEYLLTIPGAAT